jgi:hypothetical protein
LPNDLCGIARGCRALRDANSQALDIMQKLAKEHGNPVQDQTNYKIGMAHVRAALTMNQSQYQAEAA